MSKEKAVESKRRPWKERKRLFSRRRYQRLHQRLRELHMRRPNACRRARHLYTKCRTNRRRRHAFASHIICGALSLADHQKFEHNVVGIDFDGPSGDAYRPADAGAWDSAVAGNKRQKAAQGRVSAEDQNFAAGRFRRRIQRSTSPRCATEKKRGRQHWLRPSSVPARLDLVHGRVAAMFRSLTQSWEQTETDVWPGEWDVHIGVSVSLSTEKLRSVTIWSESRCCRTSREYHSLIVYFCCK